MELSDISQAQKERLAHIDFRTYFLGEIGRSDLVARFGIGEAAATRDITLYREMEPANLDYDTKLKSYVKSGVLQAAVRILTASSARGTFTGFRRGFHR